jgi:hypothetical protein
MAADSIGSVTSVTNGVAQTSERVWLEAVEARSGCRGASDGPLRSPTRDIESSAGFWTDPVVPDSGGGEF